MPEATRNDCIVVVYGPMASGKTHNAEAIAEHFRCDGIIDNFPHTLEEYDSSGGGASRGTEKVQPGTLLLVTAPEVSAYSLRKTIVRSNPDALNVHMTIVPISEALEAIAPES